MCILKIQLFCEKDFFLYCKVSSCPLSEYFVTVRTVQVPTVTVLLGITQPKARNKRVS